MRWQCGLLLSFPPAARGSCPVLRRRRACPWRGGSSGPASAP